MGMSSSSFFYDPRDEELTYTVGKRDEWYTVDFNRTFDADEYYYLNKLAEHYNGTIWPVTAIFRSEADRTMFLLSLKQ